MSEVQMYTTHVTCYRRELLEDLGGLREGTEGCQDWDLSLRAAEQTDNIVHIPKILYHWRVYPGSTALANSGAKDWAYENQKKMLKDYLERKNYEGEIIQNKYEGLWRIKFNIRDGQKVAVIVFDDGDLHTLRASLASIVKYTEYRPCSIYILTDAAESELLEKLNLDFEDIECSIETFDEEAINNRRAINRVIKDIDSDHVAFVDNSVRVHRGWLSSMLEYSQREEVGMVGGKLVLPDGRIWYAGTIVGINGWRGYSHRFLSRDISGYNGWLMSVRNVISLSSDFMMIKRNLFIESGGFDENLPIKTRDLDLGMELHEKGYSNVYTSFAKASYMGDVGIIDGDEIKKKKGFKDFVIKRDKYFKQGCKVDPFYNENLSCDYEDFRLNL
jgi:cellulose synthase/poly-beta-1,6-N-acetylglucosamine synthase-like glycosyltransferase